MISTKLDGIDRLRSHKKGNKIMAENMVVSAKIQSDFPMSVGVSVDTETRVISLFSTYGEGESGKPNLMRVAKGSAAAMTVRGLSAEVTLTDKYVPNPAGVEVVIPATALLVESVPGFNPKYLSGIWNRQDRPAGSTIDEMVENSREFLAGLAEQLTIPVPGTQYAVYGENCTQIIGRYVTGEDGVRKFSVDPDAQPARECADAGAFVHGEFGRLCYHRIAVLQRQGVVFQFTPTWSPLFTTVKNIHHAALTGDIGTYLTLSYRAHLSRILEAEVKEAYKERVITL